MTDTQHTPGPWFVTPDGTAVYKKDGYGYRGDTICLFVGHPFIDANARLIAAAPELLAALQALAALPNKHRPEEMWDAARAAIAKATGGQP